MVLFEVAERRANSALRRARMGTDRIKFGDDGDAGLGGKIEGGHQARSPCADNHRVVTLQHALKLEIRNS